ncbi:MAG: hypothetical protein OEM39_01110 [Acidimicrobiia bacterium]|nr:hypothetical protein [Acidimicrobiia bacterium]
MAAVTIAPELSGAEEVAGILASGGVNVSAGHTGSTYEMAARAREGGRSSQCRRNRRIDRRRVALSPAGYQLRRTEDEAGAGCADFKVL